MSAENHCPHCGAELAANAPQGLCPACLLKGGLATQTGGSGGSHPTGDADFVPPTPAELASHFPELEILELVGCGGMGVVYKARQKRLDRLVALKLLSPKIGQDPAFAERFAREARAMARLNHPHIVAVYDFGQADGLYYFLMEFVDGVNLRQLLDSGKLSPPEALAIVPQICGALQFAHDHGIVHRDIKPENLLLDKNGQVKIADFGLAKLVGQKPEDLTLTGAGQVMGTPQYMAPEQIEHPLAVDHRADIYSLGVVFYQMLTGELPIGRFAPPSKKVQIDVRLDEVVLRALEKEPELRYQQVSEIKAEVETIATTPTIDRPLPPGGDTDDLDRARRRVKGPAIGLLLLGISGLLIVPVIFALLIYSSFHAGPTWGRGNYVLGIVAFIAAAVSIVIMVAAVKMKRLESYGLALAASVLAIVLEVFLVSPCSLIGLPIAIWSLVVLSQQNVRTAFGCQSRIKFGNASPRVTGFENVPGVIALVLCLAAFPIALFLIPRVGGNWLAAVEVFCALQIAALILGVIGWRSSLAKAAVVVSAIFLVAAVAFVIVSTAIVAGQRADRELVGEPGIALRGPNAKTVNLEVVVDVRRPVADKVSDYEDFTGTIEAAPRADPRSQETVYVAFSVDERTILRLRRMGIGGMNQASALSVSCGLADDEGFPYHGKVKSMEEQLDPINGTALWHAALANPQGILLPGMFARVRLFLGNPHPALLVPEKALISDQGKTYLFVVNAKNVVEQRSVELGGKENDDQRVVQKGLTAEDWVVVSGLRGLRPGMTVKPMRAASTTVPTPTISAEAPASAAKAETDRVKLQYAQRQVQLVEAQYQAGTATYEELLAARRDRDVAAADMKGDKPAAARARLQYAEERLKVIESRFSAGMAGETDRLAAQRDRDVAAAELQKLDRTPHAQAEPAADAPGPVLIYEVDPLSAPAGKSASEMDSLLKTIDRRLNAGAEKLARVRKLDNGRMEVALLRRNDADRQRVERLLTRAGTLEFRILANHHHDKAVIEEARKDPSKTDVLDSKGKRLAWWVPVKASEEKSFAGLPDVVRRSKKRDNHEITEILVLADPCNVTGAYLAVAEAITDPRGKPCISLTFNNAGGKLFAKLTGAHLPDGTPGFIYKLGIILDGELFSAPAIMSRISNQAVITGSFTKEQVSDLAEVLNAGSLPVRLRLVPAALKPPAKAQ